MTFEEMNLKGFVDTEAGLKKFNKLIAIQYKNALDEIRQGIQALYNKVTGNLSITEVAERIKKNPSWYYVQANKYNRLTALQKKIQDLYVKASISAGYTTVEASKQAITNNFYAQRYGLDFASATSMSFSVINPAVIELSVLGTPKVWDKLTEQAIKRIEAEYGSLGAYQPKYGSLTDVLVKNRKSDIVKIKNTITQGLIQGKSYNKLAKDIKHVLNGSTSQALTVLRTESMRNMNSGAYASHMLSKSQGLDVKRMAVETLDDRTRAQSQRIDGQLTDENDQFTYPNGMKVDIIGNSGVPKYDINDRGRSVEVIDGQPPEQRRGKNPLTGKYEVMSYKTYPEYMKFHGFTQNKNGKWIKKG